MTGGTEDSVDLGAGFRKRAPVRRKQPQTVQEADRMMRAERARYANLETGFRKRCQAMLARFEAGRIDRKAFIQTFSTELYRFQAQMYVSGRRSAGRFDNVLDEKELAMLHGQHSREMRYFHGFVRDIEAGKGRMQYKHRMDLYALGGYSVYMRGAVLNFPNAKEARWLWDNSPEAEHCDTCIRNDADSKAQGGFTLKEILEVRGFPGERTICGNRCRCHLKPVRGRLSTKRTRPTRYTDEVARAAALEEHGNANKT